ncbi:MAG TPA: YidC/Oxa1 family membrane protein insertase [Solirubrobacteraceae bacterium]|nr:YidC/Oxa1 family membrane protein insertase [Solirubrobacteraceae bacterium]
MLLLTANIFQPLIDVFEAVLKFFHNNVGISWGWSIVLLTVVMRAILLPLTVKQFHSMQRLQRMQPQLKALQNKYKDDKQRQQQELMKFYKENQINPLGSCLPLVAQLPVFISLFYMLRQDLRKNICPQTQAAYQAKYAVTHHVSAQAAASQTTPCGPHNGAGFLFIPDLTNKATGIVLVVLLVLYIGTQLASSLMMSSPMMDQTQRRMMMLLPLFFVVIVINFPAGLLVYWITTNAWTMGQQYVVRRMVGTPTPPVGGGPGGDDGGGGGRDGPGGGRSDSDGGGPSDSGGNGSGGGGLGGMLRGRAKPEPEPAGVGAGSGTRRGAPPPPPRKKKKRSGRRR